MAIVPKSEPSKPVIDLTGPDGNAFVLLGHASKLCKTLRMSGDETAAILTDMKSGDYEQLITTFDKHFGEYVDLAR